MRGIGKRGLGLPLLIGAFFLVISVAWAGGDGGGAQTGSPAAGASEPGPPLRELEAANAMLMEILANCTEENEALTDKLARCRGSARTPRKDRLIQQLGNVLGVSGTDMGYLSKLSKDELQFLLKAIRYRVSGEGTVNEEQDRPESGAERPVSVR